MPVTDPDPATRKLIWEIAASLGVALGVAGLLFRVFFEDWRDFFLCCPRRPSFNNPDHARGFFYNVIWNAAGFATFFCIHKIFG
jgi:hypothetical protein